MQTGARFPNGVTGASSVTQFSRILSMHRPDLPDHREHVSAAECGFPRMCANLFAGFDPHALNRLGQDFTTVKVPDGAVGCRQAETADAFYIVARGDRPSL